MSFSAKLARRLRGPALFIVVLLLVEFLDEFIFSAREAAWPLIRSDLGLSYEQVGLLLSLPLFIGNLIEPVIGILGDVWKRRAIVLVGGIFFAVSTLLVAMSAHFVTLMIAFIIFSPASGAFVGLAQSTLMDLETSRHQQNMARWTFAGSVGVVMGSVALGAVVAFGLGWRSIFVATIIAALTLVMVLSRIAFPGAQPSEDEMDRVTVKAGIRNALNALRRREVFRWLVLLEFSDLMLDVLYGYLALYFVDVVGVGKAEAALAVTVWTGVGLVGDLLLIPLLERVQGLAYLRLSALLELILFPAFLLVPGIGAKLVILGALGFFNSGWYSILKGQLYSSMPGQSGTVMTVGNVAGLLGSLIPLGIGLAAERFGLGISIWLLLAGPIVLLLGLPRMPHSYQPADAVPVNSAEGQDQI